MTPATIGAGEGRGQLRDEVPLRVGIVRGLSEFLERLTDPAGALLCPRHKVEHTGKVVYGAVINLQAWRWMREDYYLERAKRQVLRAVDRLGLDPESQVPVFLPGRVDPRNASTNAIDGGACTDVIATLLAEVPEAFSAEETARCRDALVRHVDGYLRHAARERPITAQRLWAGTGVARAARLLGRRDWAADALAGCARALDELQADGISPYIPRHVPECTHPGLADASAFYHSRTPGFVLDIHEVLGEPLSAHARERLAAALDALVALRGGDGRKIVLNEAKPWYWESAYEVASHAFDVHALAVGARLLDRPLYAGEAGAALEEWIAHLSALDGGVQSHHGPGVNFQCRVFWSGHAAWIVRVLHDVPLHRAPRPPLVLDLPASGLVHVEHPRATAVLRGRKRPHGNLFGCTTGGGTLQSLFVRDDPRLSSGYELIGRPGEGSVRLRPRAAPGRLARWLALLSTDAADLRFRLYVASVEWRAGRVFGAPAYAWRHVVRRPWRDAGAAWCARFDTETEQEVTSVEGHPTVFFRGGLADRQGARWPGTRTERRYRFLDDRVELDDQVFLEGVRGRLDLLLPLRLEQVGVEAEGLSWSRLGRRVRARVDGGAARLRVTGCWRT